MRLILCSVCLLASFAVAGDLSLDELARIQSEQNKAKDAIAKKYGDKPSGEQRRQMVKEQQEAAKAVLDKAGVKQADFVRATARAGANDVDNAVKEIDKADAAKKKAGDSKAAPASGAGKNAVDQAADDQAAAAAMDKEMKQGGKK
ncbi:MAG: hypothetical protein JNM17_34505 [Archangium sp.]|nr:hypothetical protein [Archangium sp.]